MVERVVDGVAEVFPVNAEPSLALGESRTAGFEIHVSDELADLLYAESLPRRADSLARRLL